MDNTVYIAVIGDLVKSRELPDRAGVQKRLQATLDEINEELSELIASRFLITLGDEFQGLLHANASISDVWWLYQERMHEHAETRFGFGVGTLSTELREETLDMDGSCLHAARAAIERGHRQKSNLSFEIAGNSLLSEAFNSIAGLLGTTISDWTPVQWTTILLLRRLDSQVEVAKAREVTPQSVRDVLTSSRGAECIHAWAGIDRLLSEISGRHETQ